MEFSFGLQSAVTNHARALDADAEHTAIMRDMDYVVAAEAAGFKYALLPEHHFLDEFSHMSANDVALGYLAHSTSKIHLMSGIFNPLPQVNHPVKVAERAAMLDHLTNGRFEFGTGRGAGSHEVLGFLPDYADTAITREIWADVITEFPKMWMQEEYQGYSSKWWTLPPRKVLPKPWIKPHPPMWYAAGSKQSWEMAGRMGLGLLGFSIDAFDIAAQAVQTYKKAVSNAEPVGAFVNDMFSATNFAIVCEDKQKAIDLVCSPEVAYYSSLMYRYHDTFERPAGIPQWPDLVPRIEPEAIPAMQEAGTIVGDIDDALRICRRWEEAGVDVLNIGIGTYGEEHALESIRVFGEYIIPELDKSPVHRTDVMRGTAA